MGKKEYPVWLVSKGKILENVKGAVKRVLGHPVKEVWGLAGALWSANEN